MNNEHKERFLMTTFKRACELVADHFGSPVVREYGAKTVDGRWIVLHGTEAELSGQATGGYAGDGVTTVTEDGKVEFTSGFDLWTGAEDVGVWPNNEHPLFPQVEVELSDQDGNAFSIIGRTVKAMRRAGVPEKDRQAYVAEATSGDYNHVLQTTIRTVTTS